MIVKKMIAAASNIAWTTAEDPEAESVLKSLGIKALELAPTRYWPDLSAVAEDAARAAAEAIQMRGFQIVAFQAVLFGQPELHLFGPRNGQACSEYLAAVCRLAGWMGVPAIVLGAPKNRLRGPLSSRAALIQADTFFKRLGEIAEESGTTVCLEPNPKEYGADFLLTVHDTAALVQAVNSPGIALNFDMGEQAIHRADTPSLLQQFGHLIGHFHVSEPMLGPFNSARPDHGAAAGVLREIGYAGAVSLEMKTPAGGLPVVCSALEEMMASYRL